MKGPTDPVNLGLCTLSGSSANEYKMRVCFLNKPVKSHEEGKNTKCFCHISTML